MTNANQTSNQTKTNSLQAPTRTTIVLASILIFLQILDGILTGKGMELFGTSMEGNTLLRSIMDTYGIATALVLAKGFAISVILGLVYASKQVKWVPVALAGTNIAYLSLAIVPWITILNDAI